MYTNPERRRARRRHKPRKKENTKAAYAKKSDVVVLRNLCASFALISALRHWSVVPEVSFVPTAFFTSSD